MLSFFFLLTFISLIPGCNISVVSLHPRISSPYVLQRLLLSSGWHLQELSFLICVQCCILWYSCPFMCLKMHSLISSGLAYKLRSGALWRRRHSGVQNDENASRSATTQGHESHAGHEGTYHPALRAIIIHNTYSATPSHLHLLTTSVINIFNDLTYTKPQQHRNIKFSTILSISHSNFFV